MLDAIFIGVVADIVINLAAAYFAVVVVVPITRLRHTPPDTQLVIDNLIWGSVALAVAYQLRRLIA